MIVYARTLLSAWWLFWLSNGWYSDARGTVRVDVWVLLKEQLYDVAVDTVKYAEPSERNWYNCWCTRVFCWYKFVLYLNVRVLLMQVTLSVQELIQGSMRDYLHVTSIIVVVTVDRVLLEFDVVKHCDSSCVQLMLVLIQRCIGTVCMRQARSTYLQLRWCTWLICWYSHPRATVRVHGWVRVYGALVEALHDVGFADVTSSWIPYSNVLIVAGWTGRGSDVVHWTYCTYS